ncbi:hypothetical protein R5R35_002765 [Gryllus longicercus]|uniref:Elongation factor Ts, mitochondrial n=1 Tax=Gryllus longicercus TaxID=2509291 RepID=A0AAN9WLP4_9ORTH
MFSGNIIRFIHVGYTVFNASNKTLLSKLRKQTGYTFANCKKALELNDYNYSLAEKWLQDQAQQLGWSKATKLEGRITAQGLVAVGMEKNNAVIVEVNCETDFVARNKNFSSLVELAATTCLNHTASVPVGSHLSRFQLDAEILKSLKVHDGKTLSDHLALVIGKVGENLSLRRATCFHAADGILLAGYAHPSPNFQSSVLLGKFGAVVAYQADSPSQSDTKLRENLSVDEIGRQLCQHVVGMNPVKIGEVGQDTPANNPDDESCMIYQEYLLDPSQTVGEMLASTSISVLDFARYECGEELLENTENNSSKVAVEIGG